MMSTVARAVLWTIALFYGYGAAVHVFNILGLSGFDWSEAPLKWQALDLIYLALDLIVAVGFFLRSRLAYLAFYVAALSQIVLYTLLRSWILDVPPDFAPTPEQRSYLSLLVAFHVVTLTLVSVVLRFGTFDGKGANRVGA
jgi:hypothetical protein